MMNCRNAEDLLWSLCEGSLAEDSARLVGEHLAGCAKCRRARAEIQTMLAAMRSVGEGVGEIEPSPDFQARLQERIDAWEIRKRVFWITVWAGFLARNRRLLAASGVAFAVALAGGLYVMRGFVGPGHMVAKQSEAAKPTEVANRGAASYEGVGLTRTGSGPAPESGVRQDYVLREFPYSAPVLRASDKDAPDTIYVRYPTRDLTPPRGIAGDNYIYQPVVTPVSEGEPIF